MSQPSGEQMSSFLSYNDSELSPELISRLDKLNTKYAELLERAEAFQKRIQETSDLLNEKDLTIPAEFVTALQPPPETVTWERPFDEDLQPPEFLAKSFYPFVKIVLSLVWELYKNQPPPKDLQDQLRRLLPAYIYTTWLPEGHEPDDTAIRLVMRYPEVFTSKSALETILRQDVQPFFNKTLPNVTEAGHARLHETPKSRRVMAFEDTKPGDSFALVRPEAPGLLQFVVSNLRPTDLKDLWPLIIPPLLHLTETTKYRIRAQSYIIGSTLFEKTDPALLERTGLFSILWDTLQPGLFSLPPLTPLHHAIPLLNNSLLALRRLASLHPTDATKFRAEIMKEGIMDRAFSTSENITVTSIYVRHISGILAESDLTTKKELMNRYRSRLIPIIRKKLSDPFVAVDKEYLCRLASTLTSIICSDVDGMLTEQWNMEIIAGVGLAWVRVGQEAKKTQNLIVRRELRRVLITLREIIGQHSVGWQTIERVCRSRQEAMGGLIAAEDPDEKEWEKIYETGGVDMADISEFEKLEKNGARSEKYFEIARRLIHRSAS